MRRPSGEKAAHETIMLMESGVSSLRRHTRSTPSCGGEH